MKVAFAAVLVLLLIVSIPAPVLAKGDTVRITIKGGHLTAPIEISDPKVLTKFSVWTGPGTGSSVPGFNPNVPGFIIDWSKGPVAEPPKGLRSYEVSFYTKLLNEERLVYVVSYELDSSTQLGYVYLPGKTNENYVLNVGTIYRGVEGNWFRAWSMWDKVATSLIGSP